MSLPAIRRRRAKLCTPDVAELWYRGAMTNDGKIGNPPSERIVDLYERQAHNWDADRGRSLFEKPWLDRFAALLPPGASILDIGCGSAEPIGRYLIEEGFHLAGVDSSPTLIALCRARFPTQNWTVADMRTLALGQTFHGLIAWDSFFHLSHAHQRRMFPIFRTHSKPGAALLFTTGPAHGETIGSCRGEALYHASLSAAEYRTLLAANGFAVVRSVAEDPDCGRHTVWLAQLNPTAVP
ncbi:MAG: class I SAM-dependent methyltransferase [Rhodoplanes sp.]